MNQFKFIFVVCLLVKVFFLQSVASSRNDVNCILLQTNWKKKTTFLQNFFTHRHIYTFSLIWTWFLSHSNLCACQKEKLLRRLSLWQNYTTTNPTPLPTPKKRTHHKNLLRGEVCRWILLQWLNQTSAAVCTVPTSHRSSTVVVASKQPKNKMFSAFLQYVQFQKCI